MRGEIARELQDVLWSTAPRDAFGRAWSAGALMPRPRPSSLPRDHLLQGVNMFADLGASAEQLLVEFRSAFSGPIVTA